jgi:hypothetical protein
MVEGAAARGSVHGGDDDPMAVFLAVLTVFTRLGAEGTLGAARRNATASAAWSLRAGAAAVSPW